MIIVILSVLLAVLIPICAFLARDYFTQEKADPVSEMVSVSSESSSEDDSTSPEEEEEPSSSEPDEPTSGLVSESEPVGQDYFDDAVFFGDSITAGINVYELMSNAQVIAATGINPSSVLTKAVITVPGSEDRITMMDALRASRPVKIYIQLGANWVGERSGIDESTFIEHYRALIEQIKEDHPESIIYIQSMFPVSRAYDTNENGKNTYGLTNELIRTFNKGLEEMAEEEGVWYLNLYDELCNEDGYLPDDKTSDGMHLVPQYYEKWFEYLKTHAVPASTSNTENELSDSDESTESNPSSESWQSEASGISSDADDEISAPDADILDDSESESWDERLIAAE